MSRGIVRRIDDLGRVVIPKEYRRILRVKEGDPIEVYSDQDGIVVLKKYTPVKDIQNVAEPYADTIAGVTGHIVLVTDQDYVVVASSNKTYFLGKPVGQQIKQVMEDRRIFGPGWFSLDDTAKTFGVVVPIIVDGDVLGTVIIFDHKEINEDNLKIAQIAASFVGKNLV